MSSSIANRSRGQRSSGAYDLSHAFKAIIIKGRAEITIHEADRFDLSFTQPPGTIPVNKAPFAMSRNRRGAAFVRRRSGWELTGRD
jgi:hypothetical protein